MGILVLFLFSDSVRYVFIVRVLFSESQAADSVISYLGLFSKNFSYNGLGYDVLLGYSEV